MPQLDFANYPFLSQFFWLAVSFAALYIYSAKVILPRISKILEIRSSTIETAIADAEKIKQEAERFVAEGDNILNKARLEAKKIIQKAEEEIKEASKKELVKLNKKLAEQLVSAKQEIDSFKKGSKKEIDELSENIYQNLLKKLA